MMFSINVWMALTALLIIPLTILITFGFVKRSQKLFDLQQEMVGELNGTITELYGGLTKFSFSTDRKIPATDFLQSIKRWQMPHLRLSSFLP